MTIHRTAVVHPSVRIGRGVEIGPYAIVDADVEIGDNVRIDAHAMIKPYVRIGAGSRIFSGAVVGEIPQDLKFNGELSEVIIGEGVRIREFVTVNRGTRAAGRTVIGDHSLLMAYVHVAHDCIIGRSVVLSNCVQLAGHVEVGDYAVLGGMSAVHQFVRIGAHVMVGGGSLVRVDVPPFVKVGKEPLRYVGVNIEGLRRRNFSARDRAAIEAVYEQLFVRHSNIQKAMEELDRTQHDNPWWPIIKEFIQRSRQGKRGLVKGMHGLRTPAKTGD